MAEVNRRWIYPTVTASENKGIERIALSGEGLAHEVVGIDGSRKFGCRPSSGMQYVHTLNMLKDFSGESNPPPVATKASTVTDCFPVHFQIREGHFGYGFVYRVKTGSAAAIYMDFEPTISVDVATGWRTLLVSDHATNDVDPDAKMDVVCMGRYVFVFVQGRAARIFYVEGNDWSSPIYTSVVQNAGAGLSPKEATFSSGTQFSSPALDHYRFALSISTHSSGHSFSEGDYSFGFYLYNSLTGRRTPLSEVAGRDASYFTGGSKEVTLYFEADTSRYDQIYLFRSVRLQSVGGVYTGSILHLDGIYDLDDATYVADADDETDPYTGSLSVFSLNYQLDDIALAMQEIYLDRVIYDAEVPYAGSAVPFDGSLILCDPVGPTGATTTGPFATAVSIAERERNVGEIRWSSLTERSPELFPINNKYSPDVFQNRITKLIRTGDFAVGFSKDRLYHIRRSGLYLRIEDIHAGFGLEGQYACAAVGPLVYFITNKGMKAIANNGQLDDVQALDNLLLEDWYDDLPSLRLAYDPYASCLFILNPNEKKTVCMWFSTGRVSELHDVPFTDVRTGIWREDWTNTGSVGAIGTTTSMVERAFFLQNHPSTLSVNIPDGWEPRVYILDYDRVKESNGGTVIADNTSTIRTLEFDGDVLFTVKSVTQGLGVTTVDFSPGTTGNATLSSGSGYDLVGAYAYIVGSSDQSKIGLKQQIYSVTPGTVSGGASIVFNRWTNIAAGDVIALSPVLFRYVGGALPMIRTEDNQVVSTMDLFQNKQASSVGCHFSDVSGGTEGYRFFKGLVYNTEGDSPAVSAFPVDFAGTIIGDSIQTGESEDYAAFTTTGLTTTGRHGIQDSALNPGIEIFCPDVDFKLMAVICRGRSTNTDTSGRTSP